MLVFLYEFVSGGGFLGLDNQPMPDQTLLREGEAMWSAIYEDLSLLPDVEVISIRDARLCRKLDTSTTRKRMVPLIAEPARHSLWRHTGTGRDDGLEAEPKLPGTSAPGIIHTVGDDQDRFVELANNADLTLLIAPEFDGHLLDRARQLENLGCKLLSPNSSFIDITADKTKTIKTLTAAGVPTPSGQQVDVDDSLPTDFPLPAVLKVNDGAGSMCYVIDSLDSQCRSSVMRIEQFVAGLACSVSFLCRGTETPIACPPIQQILSSDGQLEYLGGKRILNSQLIDRATKLGVRVLSTLPPTNGYVGIDLVLGDDLSGNGDYVIEVNPRLTTSYIGLREIATSSLAAAMLQIARGESPDVQFSNGPVNFLSDGTIR